MRKVLNVSPHRKLKLGNKMVLIEGTYTLNMVFRDEDNILDQIHKTLLCSNFYYEDFSLSNSDKKKCKTRVKKQPIQYIF